MATKSWGDPAAFMAHVTPMVMEALDRTEHGDHAAAMVRLDEVMVEVSQLLMPEELEPGVRVTLDMQMDVIKAQRMVIEMKDSIMKQAIVELNDVVLP